MFCGRLHSVLTSIISGEDVRFSSLAAKLITILLSLVAKDVKFSNLSIISLFLVTTMIILKNLLKSRKIKIQCKNITYRYGQLKEREKKNFFFS